MIRILKLQRLAVPVQNGVRGNSATSSVTNCCNDNN